MSVGWSVNQESERDTGKEKEKKNKNVQHCNEKYVSYQWSRRMDGKSGQEGRGAIEKLRLMYCMGE